MKRTKAIDSKLTSKFQATIPRDVRQALHVGAGDRIVFEIRPDLTIVIKKADGIDRSYLRSIESTLSEWNSRNDDEDFNDL